MTNAIVGFSLITGLTPEGRDRALAAQREALAPFLALTHHTLSIGVSQLDLWGRGELSNRLHRAPDGSALALVGSPHGTVSWTQLADSVRVGDNLDLDLPWEGRVVLVKVSADGLNSDLHASAAYRAHLIGVLARRAVAKAA